MKLSSCRLSGARFASLLAALLIGTLCACDRPAANVAPPGITVFAAASTAEAIEQVARRFERETGVPVRINLGSSSTLARQILAGAPADIFLSASAQWTDAVDEEGLVAARCDLLSNRLVIVTPAAAPRTIQTPTDLRSPQFEHLAVADVAAVPAGIYAREALQRLGIWDDLQPRLVQGADVRQALLFVERGEAQAGIIYATDARASRGVSVAWSFPAGSTSPIVYPLSLLTGGQGGAVARRFYNHMQSHGAAELFRAQGFGWVPQDD